MRRPVTYIRLFSDDAGESHLETATMTVAPEQFAPPAPPLDVSPTTRATEWRLLRFAPDCGNQDVQRAAAVPAAKALAQAH